MTLGTAQHLRRNAVAYLALAVALGTGTAYAAPKIANGSVTTKKIATNAVTSSKIKNGAVKAIDIRGGAVTSFSIADGSGVQAWSVSSVSPRRTRSSRNVKPWLSNTDSELRPTSMLVMVQPSAQSRTRTVRVTGVPSAGTAKGTATEPVALEEVT